MLGLGLSGHPDAAAALQEAQRSRASRFKSGILEAAIESAQLMRTTGVRRFYREQQALPSRALAPAEPAIAPTPELTGRLRAEQ